MDHKESTRIIRRLFWGIFPVQALATGLPAIGRLLNSIIIGKFLGEQALAVIGFVGPLNLCVTAISIMICSGAQLLCSRYLGKGDREGMSRAFSTALIMGTLFGLLLAAAAMLFSEKMAVLLGATGELTSVTAQYLLGWGPNMAFAIISWFLTTMLQMERKSTMCTIVTGISLVINLGGNLFNVLYLKWGVFGAGLFTSASSIVSVLIMLPYVLIRSKLVKFSLASIQLKEARQILCVGSSNAANIGCGMIRNRVINQYVFALGGTSAMAAMSIAQNICSLLSDMLEDGLNNVGRMIGGVLAGNRDSSSLRDLPKVMIKASVPVYYGFYAILFLFARPLALLLGADAEHIALYVAIIRIFNTWLLINPLRSTYSSIYAAMGKVKLLFLVNILSNGVTTILLCLTLGRVLGLYFVSTMIFVQEVAAVLLFAAIFIRRAHRMPRSIFELCYIPSTISAPRENRFKATICTLEEATKASEQAIGFCKGRGISDEAAYYCGLCIEEMTVDTIQNRFDRRGTSIDLRVIYEDGHICVTLRDDCRHFDPNEWLELCAPEEAMRGIGIRMVKQLATEMSYVNTLGLNVLTIKI